MQYNNSGLLTKQTYGNGDYVSYTYDKLDRVTEKSLNGNNNQRVTYAYGNNGSVAQAADYYTNTNTRFTYDLANRLVSQREYTGTGTSGGTLVSSTDFTYADKTNYLIGVKHNSPLGKMDISYIYGNIQKGYMPDQVYFVNRNGERKLSNTYDELGRLEKRWYAGNTAFYTKYAYEDAGTDKTTTLVKSAETPAGTYTYTYDALGNITSVNDGTYTTSYVYDSLNQLIRENNEREHRTYTYEYENGNITDKKTYYYTTGELGSEIGYKTWEYENSTWGDLLTNYDGTEITYDEIGNPVTYGEASLEWQGRQLQSITEDGVTASYEYNGEGQRVSKTFDGVTTEFYYNGSILAGQKTGEDTILFEYDNNGDPFAFLYNGTEYYYVKNAQNDVTAIANATGTVLANYYYDAWGNILTISGDTALADANPIRYRSYYCDTETGWYYLNSRYYIPEMCRFLNADGIVGANQDILAYNMFAYCSNNPINFLDENGQSKVSNWFKKLWNDFKTSSSAKLSALGKTIKNTLSTTFKAAKKAYSTTARPKNIGAGTWEKTVGEKTKKLTKLRTAVKAESVGIAIDVGASVLGDWMDGAPPEQIFDNAMVELMFGMMEICVSAAAANLFTALVLAFGSGAILAVNPLAVGAGVAFAFSIVVDFVPFGGMTIKDRAKNFFNEAN